MASATQDLDIFVRDALARGATRESIASTLASAGWSAAQTTRALSAYADVDYVVPVPRPRASLSAREAFFYLLMFAALYMVAWHLGSLLFDLLDRALPDAADAVDRFGGYQRNSMRRHAASLIVALPVYLWMARIVARDVTRDPLRRLSPVRRWLTYLTLFIAAIAMICDMVALVDNMLGGELTTRFLLKVLVVAAIAGSAFSYYLLDLRRGEAA